jgi:hypothetical protein
MVCVLTVGWSCPVLADGPTSRPTAQDLDSPQDSLIAYDHWCVDLQDFDDATSFYSTNTDREKTFAQECLKFDQLAGAVERLARTAFGVESCKAILHEFSEPDASDLRGAKVTMSGDTAMVEVPSIGFRLQMVKTGNGWVVDTDTLMKTYGGFDKGVQVLDSQIGKFQPIVDGLQSGKYKTAQEVIHAIDGAIGG